MFTVTWFCYIEVLIHIFCFGWGKESRLLYRGHHYIKRGSSNRDSTVENLVEKFASNTTSIKSLRDFIFQVDIILVSGIKILSCKQ